MEANSETQNLRRISVSTHDISLGGFALVINQFVHSGTVIRAQFATLPTRPPI